MEFRILGSLEVGTASGVLVPARPSDQKALATLLLDAGRVVPLTRLVDALWGEEPPATAGKQVQNAASRLRRQLAANETREFIVSECGGYRLVINSGQLDAQVFKATVTRAGLAVSRGQVTEAAGLLRSALDLWRGPALAGMTGQVLEAAAVALEERRCAAAETFFDLQLALGCHREVVAELQTLVAEHPLREKPAGQLMLALYRCGRRSDALASYARIQAQLAGELGLDPGPALQRLRQQILTADSALSMTRQQYGTARVTAHLTPPATAEQLPAGQRLSGPVAHPAELPHDVPGFIGREAELTQLAMAVACGPQSQRSMIAAIIGAAGVGKTALVTRFAHRAASWFPDGQLWIDLHGFDPCTPPLECGEALAMLLRALGADPDQIPAALQERSARYRSMLSGQRILIVLDNAASAGQVRPLLPGYPGCLVLITSRNRLASLVTQDGATRISLRVLSLDTATELVERAAGARRALDGRGAAADVARLCGCLPLALRLAAERLVARPELAVAALAAGLASERDRLDGLADDQGSQVVRAAFACSYRGLRPAEARMFWLLGLHAGPSVSTAAAAALAAISRVQAARLLDGLAAGHLIEEIADNRYRLHDLLRIYAAEQAGTAANRELAAMALQRLLGWYLHTADAADRTLAISQRHVPLEPPPGGCVPLSFATSQEALNWCETERANLLAACRQAGESGLHTTAWKLPVSLVGFFRLYGDRATWLATHQAALAAARQAADLNGQAQVLGSLGVVHRELGQPKAAIRCHQQALALWARLGDRQGEAGILNNLGNNHWDAGRYTQALGCYHKALSGWRAAGDQAGQGIALNNIGTAHRELGCHLQAFSFFQQALAIRRAIADRYGEGHTLTELAITCHHDSQPQQAIGYFQQAVGLCRRIGDRPGEAQALVGLAKVLADTGQIEAARESVQQALVIFENTGSPKLKDARRQLARLGTTRSCPPAAGQAQRQPPKAGPQAQAERTQDDGI